MKKTLFFIAMVAMIASFASAQIAVTASGSATTEFGMDLDEMDTGFNATASGTISIAPEIDKSSASSAVEDGDTVYGEFTIQNIRLDTDDVKADNTNGQIDGTLDLEIEGLAAKVVLGGLTLNLWTAPSLAIDYNDDLANAYDYEIFDGKYGGNTLARDIDDDDNDQFDPAATNNDDITSNAGIQAVYAIPDVLDIQVDVKSHDIWSDQTFENEYGFRFGVNLTAVENLTFAAAVNLANYAADQFLAIGAKAGYKIMIGEEDSITPSAGLTYKTDGNGAMTVSGGINASVAGMVITVNGQYIDTDLVNDDVEELDIVAAANLGLVDGLTLLVALQMENALGVTTVTTMGIHGKVGYAIAAGDITITPSVEGSYYDPTSTVSGTDESLYLKADVNIGGLIDNTTFNLGWDSNDLMNNENVILGNTMGQLVLGVTVSL